MALGLLLTPLAAEADLGTSSFARSLEQEGDYAAARLEWKRLAHNVAPNSPLREEALFRSAVLAAHLDMPAQALQDFERFGSLFGGSTRIPDALYRMMWLADAQQTNGSKPFADRLAQLYPRHPLTAEAAWYGIWQQTARTGNVPPSAKGPKTSTLQKRLAELGAAPTGKSILAAVLGIIPGAGHLVVGDWRTALMSLLMCSLMGAAFYSCLRLKAWGLSAFFGFVFLTVYIGSITSAYSSTLRHEHEKIRTAMAGWADLAPQRPNL